MKGKTAIILGSSRSNGNTAKLAKQLKEQIPDSQLFDLREYQISYYDYESENRKDDFIPLIKKIIEENDTLLFATPVYWYNMSAILKTFFDRFSDLIRIEKETGRKLRGKNMFVVSNSFDEELDYDYYLPFRKSAEYLGMHYLGNQHFSVSQIEHKRVEIMSSEFKV